ncbi:MAG: helix-turn-helix transcriptional regulator [Alicyclobacillus macrosporangiidus]|nr:helix-turn-helix transcriptional regulator [Alicyclobacillus macrosporangiidus]
MRPERISQICRGFVSQIGLEHIDKICNALDVLPERCIVWVKDEDQPSQ